MALPPTVALLAALAMGLVPTLLYLGLWRGLLYLRDDALVAQIRQEQFRQARKEARNWDDLGGGDADGDSDIVTACDACGTRNAAAMTHCWNCLAPLDE